MGKWLAKAIGFGLLLAILAALARWLGIDAVALPGWRALDVGMGAAALLWLLVLLKAPWDLYFEAHRVAFEQERSLERGIGVPVERRRYVAVLRPRLLGLAIGAHVLSAALIAAATFFTHGTVGYWFAAFYLVSTLFRPLLAGYAYLSARLRSLGDEAAHPREDVVELRARMEQAEGALKRTEEALERHRSAAEDELRALRQSQEALCREFESAIGRLTDNREVISGIQAFVRLIARSATPG